MKTQAHLALYRKWRPSTFDEVYGQDHITSVLKYESENGRFSHAYLFCGSRGTGKTTCAKILAKAVNCENPQGGNPCGICDACRAIDSGAATDVLEMDAASNNGVENIRDIRDEVIYSPSALKYRVYIIDEVHMLSASAFNALLKTLEEPPAHVIFILATTELQKLPATIISRCQRFDFRRISTDAIVSRLNYIARQEGIELDGEAAYMLARLAQGGMRDAISLLELCAGGIGKITPDTVNDAVGSTGRTKVIETVRAIAGADYDELFGVIDDIITSSKDINVFWQDLISLYRDMLVMKTTSSAAKYLDLTDSESAQLSEIIKLFKRETLLYHCNLLDAALQSMQRSNAVKRTVAELTLIRMSDATLDTSNEALLARIARLEDVVAGGVPLASTGSTVVKAAVLREPQKATKSGDETVQPERTMSEQSVEVASKAPAQAQPAAQQITTDTSKRVLKTLRVWAEVIDRVSRSKQPLAALLGGSRAYTDSDGHVVIRFDNQFSLFMIDREGAKDIIRASLAAQLAREMRECDVIYEVAPAKEKPGADTVIFDEIDEINKEDKENKE